MTQVLRSETFLEGFSCIQTFGDDLVLCGVEENVHIIDSDLNIKHSFQVNMGVIDCQSRENCKPFRSFFSNPNF